MDDLDQIYQELQAKLKEFIEAGGIMLAWTQAGDGVGTHDFAISAAPHHLAECLHDLREHIGPDAFAHILAMSMCMVTQAPISSDEDLDVLNEMIKLTDKDQVH